MTTLSPLHQLFSEHWQYQMQFDPLFATVVGERGYNHLLPARRDGDFQSWRERLIDLRRQQEQIERGQLEAQDQLNYDIFATLLDNEIAELGFHAYRLPISKAGGFHVEFPDLPVMAPLASAQDHEDYLLRLNDFKRYAQDYIQLMRLGLQSGMRPVRTSIEGIDKSLQSFIVGDPAQSVLYRPFTNFPAGISAAQQKSLAEAARAAIRASVTPGYQALLKFFQEEYLPGSRESVAAAELPDGREFYAHRIRYFTTLDLSAEEIHQTGHEEVRRIRAEMETLRKKAGFTGDFHQFIEYLRSEPGFYPATGQVLMEKTALVLKRMDGELPRMFKTLPRLSYGIRAIPDFAAEGNTTAYYMPGSLEAGRAGVYYVNLSDLPSRPLYEIEALSLHEAVPGHHLQLALQQELGDLPQFRRFSGFTSYVEGWALYAERLGLESGFYTDPYSDFGRLSYEMWRACRLVVDTGMHALGWSRQRAIDFMLENTSSTRLNIENEVDRYIAWPGQALAYKIGELKIRALRKRAEQHLGDRFSLREFHDVILLAGSLPLNLLEKRVEQYLAG